MGKVMVFSLSSRGYWKVLCNFYIPTWLRLLHVTYFMVWTHMAICSLIVRVSFCVLKGSNCADFHAPSFIIMICSRTPFIPLYFVLSILIIRVLTCALDEPLLLFRKVDIARFRDCSLNCHSNGVFNNHKRSLPLFISSFLLRCFDWGIQLAICSLSPLIHICSFQDEKLVPFKDSIPEI